jgi:hypothetical protein
MSTIFIQEKLLCQLHISAQHSNILLNFQIKILNSATSTNKQDRLVTSVCNPAIYKTGFLF